MKLPATTATEYTPVFDWNLPSGRKLSLFSFVAASAVLHGLCFYIFQIIYPPTVALLPPPARVSMINGETEEGRVLLRWIEAEDPALSSTTLRPEDSESLKLPELQHVPSYANYQPPLRQPPPDKPDLHIPSAQPPGPVQIPRSRQPSPAPDTATSFRFSRDIEAYGAPHIPELRFTASTGDPPQDAQFRIAIGTHGEVRHCFLETSSGDPALDEQAREYLLRCRFPQIGNRQSAIANPLSWSIASVDWGNDVGAPAAKPGSPTP